MPDRRDLLSEAVGACPIDGQEMRRWLTNATRPVKKRR
jgi:hypothetical protein